MDLCEHIDGYELALTYFPRCFDSHLKLRKGYNIERKISNRVERLRKNCDIEYEDVLLGANYIKYLSREKEIYDDIRNIDIKALYLRYDDLLSCGSTRGNEYNYLFLTSIIKMPILGILGGMDSRISCFPKNDESEAIRLFISKWNQLLSSKNREYNYINIVTFIHELNDISKDDPMLMGYNNVLEEFMIQMNTNRFSLGKKK